MNNEDKILNAEKKILEAEKEILREVKKEESGIRRMLRNIWVVTTVISLVIIGAAVAVAYVKISGRRVYTDKAALNAPTIALAPQNPGTLENVFMHAGDQVGANTVVAQVGTELIKTKTAGVIVSADNNLGKLVNRGEAVVTLFDPAELRVVGSVEENKGLKDISVGDHAAFTVDAFGGKQYEGIVDEISPSSRQGDVVFNISDKRPTQEFDVKIRFNIDLYPELKNGMSAKIWIYK